MPRTIQRVSFAFAKRGGLSPRWWWARGGDAEAFVRLCKEWTFLCCLGRGSFAVAGRAPCQQRTSQEILYIWISQISNLKSHFRQRATVAGRMGGLLREARPRQNCLGLARRLAPPTGSALRASATLAYRFGAFHAASRPAEPGQARQEIRRAFRWMKTGVAGSAASVSF